MSDDLTPERTDLLGEAAVEADFDYIWEYPQLALHGQLRDINRMLLHKWSELEPGTRGSVACDISLGAFGRFYRGVEGQLSMGIDYEHAVANTHRELVSDLQSPSDDVGLRSLEENLLNQLAAIYIAETSLHFQPDLAPAPGVVDFTRRFPGLVAPSRVCDVYTALSEELREINADRANGDYEHEDYEREYAVIATRAVLKDFQHSIPLLLKEGCTFNEALRQVCARLSVANQYTTHAGFRRELRRDAIQDVYRAFDADGPIHFI